MPPRETRAQWYARVATLVRELAAAQAKSEAAAEAKHRLGLAGRARGTSANARWARAAEHRDRLEARLLDLGVVIPSHPTDGGDHA